MKTSTRRFAIVSLAMSASLISFGQETAKIVSFDVTPDGTTNLSFNLGSSLTDGQTVQVDWGDGTLVSEKVSYDDGYSATNFYAVPKGKTVTVYGDASTIYELDASWGTGNAKIEATDISALTTAAKINFTSNSLTAIDASACAGLTSLTLGNNALTSIKLGSAPKLTSLDLSNSATLGSNHITNFESDALSAVTTLKIGYSNYETFDFTRFPALKNLYANNNSFTSIDLSPLKNLTYISITYNKLTKLDLSMYSNIQVLAQYNEMTEIITPAATTQKKAINISYNRFTFATLPYIGGTLTCTGQADVEVTPDGNKIDLSAQTSYQSTATTFAWTNGEGKTLVEGTDYTNEGGVFSFLSNQTGLVCTMTNSHTKVKALTLKTVAVDITATAIDAIEAEAEGEAEYFNLQGIRVNNPGKGIFLKRQGGKTVKVVR